MIDFVQSAKPLAYTAMHEGLLVPDEPRQMIAGGVRGQPFRQVLISAEARSRVELWREYVPPAGYYFKMGYCGGDDYFLGDDGGNLHHSDDGLTWTIVKKFSGEVTGIIYDGDIEPYAWLSTASGEIWRGSKETGAWVWQLSYSDPAHNFVGVGLADSAVVGILSNSDSVVRSFDLTGGPWIVDGVFGSVLQSKGCYSDHPGELWVATYETRPRYSSDGGATWTQTSGAAGNAVLCLCKYNGTLIAGGPGGVWRSTDDGATWATVLTDGGNYFGGVGGGPAGWLAVSGVGGIFVSDDDGQTWTKQAERADSEGGWDQRGEGVGVHSSQLNEGKLLAVFQGSVLISLDQGATWTAGTGGEAWRISVEEYQPVLLDLPYEVPANERLVGIASEETFVLVGG